MNEDILNKLKELKERGNMNDDDKIWLNDIYFIVYKKEFNRSCDNCVNQSFWELYDLGIEYELNQKLK